MKKLLNILLILLVKFSYSQPEFLMTTDTVFICEGTFYDSGGPDSNYQGSKIDTMTFISSMNEPISFHFTEFNLEHGSVNDWLEIYNGPNVNYPRIGTYSGNDSPGVIYSSNSSNSITFVFKSSFSNNLSGWSASISCLTEPRYLMSDTSIITCEGTFYDSGGPYNSYQNFKRDTMTFTSSSDKNLVITFNQFDLEINRDFLNVYDGPDVTYPLLISLSSKLNNGSTYTVRSSNLQKSLTFVFASDPTVTKSGWSATITCDSISPRNIPILCRDALEICLTPGDSLIFPLIKTGLASEINSFVSGWFIENPNWFIIKLDSAESLNIEISNIFYPKLAFSGPYSSTENICNNLAYNMNDIYIPPSGICTINSTPQSGFIYIFCIYWSETPISPVQNPSVRFSQTSQTLLDCVPLCRMTDLRVEVEPCNDDFFSLVGQLQFSESPINGNLTISTDCKGDIKFLNIDTPFVTNQNFLQVISWTIDSMQSNGDTCTLTAEFSQDSTCRIRRTFISPNCNNLSINQYDNYFKVYPNPSEKTINISVSHKISHIKVVDVIGRNILDKSNINQKNFTFDINQTGNFFVFIKLSNGVSLMRRIIIN